MLSCLKPLSPRSPGAWHVPARRGADQCDHGLLGEDPSMGKGLAAVYCNAARQDQARRVES